MNNPYVLYIPDAAINAPPPQYMWKPQPFHGSRLPTHFEIEDAFLTAHQMGARVLRVFAFTVQNPLWPLDVTDPDTSYWMLKDQKNIASGLQWNPKAGAVFDYVIKMAHKYNVYIIPSFINEWSQTGGLEAFCQAYGKKCPEKTQEKTQKTCKPSVRITFFKDPVLQKAFLSLIGPIVAKYKDESAILGWETGNELGSNCALTGTPEFDDWTRKVAALVRAMAPTGPLVIDGAMFARSAWYKPNDNIDIIDQHFYPAYAQEPNVSKYWLPGFTKIAKDGGKAIMFGEIICHTDRCLQPLIEKFIDEDDAAGLLVWAQSHLVDSTGIANFYGGGYYYHQETPPCALYGERYYNYHWPGFPQNDQYNESMVMALVQYGAARVAGRQATLGTYPSPLPLPPAPLPAKIHLSGANWYLYYTGSTGAEWYEYKVKSTSGSAYSSWSKPVYPFGWTGFSKKVTNYTWGFPPPAIGTFSQLGANPCVKMIARNREHSSLPSGVLCAASTPIAPTTTARAMSTTTSKFLRSSTTTTKYLPVTTTTAVVSTTLATTTPPSSVTTTHARTTTALSSTTLATTSSASIVTTTWTTTTTTTGSSSQLQCCNSGTATGSDICKAIYSCDPVGSYCSQSLQKCESALCGSGYLCHPSETTTVAPRSFETILFP
eukprot:TRINITY_DN63089_c0_g1_i1.p1 TRINITY_DN63089_c0_g1~~TRINITY_DN63089_c0_g1_i1.p1  ORF type:complete len:721 (-),score=76.70 TRINITY_DN63089_c0_g1_i1:346-2322(-)